MTVNIPTTGKPCTKCGKRGGNPLHAGVCNVCYSNAIFGDPSKKKEQNEKLEKFYSNSKTFFSIIFGVIALLWFIIMLPAQPDFYGIVLGWAIIGGIYLLFRIFSR